MKTEKPSLLWAQPVKGILSGAFMSVVEDRIVFLVSPAGPRENTERIACLDHAGQPVWERRFGSGEVDVFFPYRDSIYVDGAAARRIRTATGETLAERAFGVHTTACFPTANEPVFWLEDLGLLLGLDPMDLSDRWQWPDADGSVGIHDRFLCRYGADGLIEVIDLRTKQHLHHVQGPARGRRGGGMHAHCGDLWCQMYGRERRAIDVRTGAIVWQWDEANDGCHAYAEFDGVRAYFGDRNLSAYELATGEIAWRQTFGQRTTWLSCPPRVRSGRVYGGTKDERVFVVDCGRGEIRAIFKVRFEATVVLPLGDDRVVVGSHEEILCYRVE